MNLEAKFLTKSQVDIALEIADKSKKVKKIFKHGFKLFNVRTQQTFVLMKTSSRRLQDVLIKTNMLP